MALTNKLMEKLPEVAAGGGQYAQLVPAVVKQAKSSGTVTTGTAVDITLDTDTSLIEVNIAPATSLVGVYLRYQATASSSNWDEYVLPGTRHYVKPDGVTVISIIADGASAEYRIIEK